MHWSDSSNVMDQVEEKGVIVSLEGNLATVAPLQQHGCGGCSSASSCGSSLLSPLFTSRQRLLVVENSIQARPGEEVTIAMNKLALVAASLMVYLAPLLMLIIGAITGELVASAAGLEDGEIAAILTGIGFSVATFIIVRVVVRSAFFAYFFDPVLLDRR
jgi:sigma-E factor negative regulatory protein RseC